LVLTRPSIASLSLEIRLDPSASAWKTIACKRQKAWQRPEGLILDGEGRERLAKAIGGAIQRGCLKLAQFAKGDCGQDTFIPATNAPVIVAPVSPIDAQQPLGVDPPIAGWSAEKRPAEKTVYEWKRAFRELKAFLKHDDGARITAQDLVSWKNFLIAASFRPKFRNFSTKSTQRRH
jgi:hypothetical protein